MATAVSLLDLARPAYAHVPQVIHHATKRLPEIVGPDAAWRRDPAGGGRMIE